VLKVSVVIPVYNPGEYLHACVKSLLGQTLPADEFEVVFVDDGSTDESPAYLDTLAAEHPHLKVIHQENSGWPGQPRNVGIAASGGEYVFFLDHDDWFAPEALERLYDFAVDCGSDVVLPKMGGLGRPVPYHVFAETLPAIRLEETPVIDSLTPHKLFRREFLNRHQLRFPEGRRRLEDHLFVVACYLRAETISIYANYTCYVHIRRQDSANAGFRQIDWSSYFDNLAEALDEVIAHTEPGPVRNALFRRWLQVEMVNRLSGERRLRLHDDEAVELFNHAHRIAAGYFDESVVDLMLPASQLVGRAIIAGDADEVRRLAEQTVRWAVYPLLLQASWVDGRLQISGTVELSDEPPPEPGYHLSDVAHTRRQARAEGRVDELPAYPSPLSVEQRFIALFGDTDPELIEEGFGFTSVGLSVTARRTGARWSVPAVVRRNGLTASFTADLEVDTLAAGERLAKGLWDLYVHFGVLGVSQRRHVLLVPERQPGEVMPEPTEEGRAPKVAAYFTQETRALSLDVGLVKHKELRRKKPPPVIPEPEPVPPPVVEPIAKGKPEAKEPATFSRRAVRKLRRTLSR